MVGNLTMAHSNNLVAQANLWETSLHSLRLVLGLYKRQSIKKLGFEDFAVGIFESASSEQYAIDEPENAAAAEGEHLQNPDRDMPSVQAMNAQPSQQITQYHRHNPTIFVISLLLIDRNGLSRWSCKKCSLLRIAFETELAGGLGGSSAGGTGLLFHFD